jgi:hypothetical protein
MSSSTGRSSTCYPSVTYNVCVAQNIGGALDSSYWLKQWLDEKGVQADWEIDNILDSDKEVEKLIDFIDQSANDPDLQHLPPGNVGDSIVAGRRIDLSGVVGCCALECLRDTVDREFRNLWHYFDKVVVEGLDAGRVYEDYLDMRSGHDYTEMIQTVSDQAKLFLYLRNLGAEDFLVFTRKTHSYCEDHWLQHARELGIEAAFDEEQQERLVSRIVRSSKLETEKLDDDFWGVEVGSPYFEPGYIVFRATSRPSKKFIAITLLEKYASAMIADVGTARQMMLPLVEQADISSVARPKNKRSPIFEKDVILELNFPVFEGISTADFLKLRTDEQPYFERFRASLRQAVAAEIAKSDSSRSAAEVAASIENDYLRPGIADIARQVKGSRAALIKKGAISLAIGGSVAAIGALSSIPLMIVGGVSALGTSVPLAPLIYQYIDTKNVDIPMSDLYFLWQASTGRRHR